MPEELTTFRDANTPSAQEVTVEIGRFLSTGGPQAHVELKTRPMSTMGIFRQLPHGLPLTEPQTRCKNALP